jgi:flavin-dependent dehydrogenase
VQYGDSMTDTAGGQISEQKLGNSLGLDEGSRVGVIGGGPAGSFFSYFVLQMVARVGISLKVDIYERRDFSTFGPSGCNMCGGVINESLVQSLSVEGIDLPSDVVQRGIDSFYFHSASETVALYAPFHQMRIATVYRGAGPKGADGLRWRSFDGYLLELAVNNGANLIRDRVMGIVLDNGKPRIITKDGQSEPYDLVVGAIGVNTASLELFEKLGTGYKRPGTRKTGNLEFKLGTEYITGHLGNSMHAFLLDIPKLDFAAIIPKGDYVTMCLIGDNVNNEFVESFVRNPVVSGYLSNADGRSAACRCAPLASLGNAVRPFSDRVVLLGDCGMARLNKDGIGSAYRVAKIAAATVLFRGVSAEDFRKGYWPVCKAIAVDNIFGRIIFGVVGVIKKSPLLTRAIMRVARSEQSKVGGKRRMSMVLWDMFTGSAPYYEVFFRCFHPKFIGPLALSIIASIVPRSTPPSDDVRIQEDIMDGQSLGRNYHTGDVIVHEGEIGDCMYVILSGQAEVMRTIDGEDVRLAVIGKGDIVGEMAIFQKELRSATVRALTDMRVMTVDRKIFLKRVHEDPSFVFAILQKMSQRIRNLDAELAQMKSAQ